MKRWGILAPVIVLGVALAVFCTRRALAMGSDLNAIVPFVGAILGLIMVAIALARPVADWIGEVAASLFFSRRRFDYPQPAYSVPEGCAIRGQVEEALQLYRKIATDYPEELRPWAESLELIWNLLGDAERTRLLYEEGQRALRRPEDRRRLEQFYEALRAGKLPHRWPHLRGRFPER
jgi:hypothetical protein